MSRPSTDLASLFMAALDLNEDERSTYLDQNCGTDLKTRELVEEMLQAYHDAQGFLSSPPNAVVEDQNALHEVPTRPSVLDALRRRYDLPATDLNGSNDPHEGTNVWSSQELKSSHVGRYQLHGEIARGGMGAILKGRDVDLGRNLAVKVLLDAHRDKPEVISRFIEEAQIGGQLQHPGIAPVYELGQLPDKRPFFSMKLVKGETLAALLTERTDIHNGLGKYLQIFEQVCQTMAYVHSRRVIHRDLKPSNIMVGAFGEVQVMDWGLAKVLATGGIADEKRARDTNLGQSFIQTVRHAEKQVAIGTKKSFATVGSDTQMGSVMGTPAYMPPEQALGAVDRLDERCDVFGLGAILCEILTGEPPYTDNDPSEIFGMAKSGAVDECHRRLDECEADPILTRLAKQCTSPDPADRPRNAGMLSEQITEYLESVESRLREAEIERAAEAARVVAERKRRRMTLALAACIALMLLMSGAGWIAFQQNRLTERTTAKERVNASLKDVRLQQRRAFAATSPAQRIAELEKGIMAANQALESAKDPLVDDETRQNAKALSDQLIDAKTRAHLEAQLAANDAVLQQEFELIRLGHADSQRFSINDEKIVFDIDDTSAQYHSLFSREGIDVGTVTVADAAKIIRESRNSESFITAIDHWASTLPKSSETTRSPFVLREPLRDKLLSILKESDDSKWRRNVRQALITRDINALQQVATDDELVGRSSGLVIWLASVLRKEGEEKLAVKILQDAQRSYPADFWLNYELGNALSAQGQHSKALGFARAALAARPDSLGAAWGMVSILSRADRQEESHAFFEKTLQTAGGNAGQLRWLAKQLRKEKKQALLELAEIACRKAIELAPDDARVHAEHSQILFGQNTDGQSPSKSVEAAEAANKAIQLKPNRATYHVLHALALTQQQKLDQAETACRKAIDLDPADMQARYLLFQLFKEQGKSQLAITEIRKQINLDPSNASLHQLLGLVFVQTKNQKDAEAAFRRVVELAPNDPPPTTQLPTRCAPQNPMMRSKRRSARSN